MSELDRIDMLVGWIFVEALYSLIFITLISITIILALDLVLSLVLSLLPFLL